MKGRTPDLYLLFISGMNSSLHVIIGVNKFAISMCHTAVLSVCEGCFQSILKTVLTGGNTLRH